jgi:hypothetical protein
MEHRALPHDTKPCEIYFSEPSSDLVDVVTHSARNGQVSFPLINTSIQHPASINESHQILEPH